MQANAVPYVRGSESKEQQKSWEEKNEQKATDTWPKNKQESLLLNNNK
jgi:hypothetical protein